MNFSNKKVQEIKDEIRAECGCQIGCNRCRPKFQFIEQLAAAQIPCVYWMLPYKDFTGPKNIKKATQNYAKNIDEYYRSGTSICYAGTPGTGKTFSASAILKVALSKKYSIFYTTLSDMAANLTDNQVKDEYNSSMMKADFLCIDEVDSRHYSDTETSENFFGRLFEKIVRYRIQNKLPIIIATNNSKIEEAFSGQFKKIVESIASASTIIVPALGPDYRLRAGRPNGKV